MLLAIPNVSEGRDAEAIWAIADAFTSTGARLLDVHSDEDHHRTVYTLAGKPGELAPALAEGAAEAVERIDLREPRGQHPHVGVIDVAPVVFLDDERRGAACAEALLAADLLGEQGLPVYLYGQLAQGRTRAELRRGGIEALRERTPDFGPSAIEDRSGAVLVGARPPLVAFNLELTGDLPPSAARTIAARIREGGEDGLPGVRAIGVALDAGQTPQVSTNVEDHRATPLVQVLKAVQKHAPVRAAELVGLAPAAAFDGWPEKVPVRNRRTLEDAGVR